MMTTMMTTTMTTTTMMTMPEPSGCQSLCDPHGRRRRAVSPARVDLLDEEDADLDALLERVAGPASRGGRTRRLKTV